MTLWAKTFIFLAANVAMVAGEDSVDQEDVLSAFEGDEVTIACHYETSDTTPSLLWYKQTANGFPEFMLINFTYPGGQTEEKFKERFYSKINSTSKTVPLIIQNLQVSDSAVYYCALNDIKLIFGKGTLLRVEAQTKAKPKYYKLARDNTTACLGIDLNSINGSTDEPDFLKESEATRIVGDSYYSKAAIMSTYDQCPTLDGKKCEPGAGGGVEPDEKLNFLSLSVLGLRILFLKTIAFNILMTVRYWMR